VILGSIGVCDSGYEDKVFLVQLNSNGSLDSTFGNGGLLLLDYGYLSQNLIIQNNNYIVFGVTNSVYRFTDTGSIDTSFGTSGSVYLGSGVFPEAMTLTPDGKILFFDDTNIHRLRSNGVYDSARNNLVFHLSGEENSLFSFLLKAFK
jgi:hypothetical protein